MPEEGDMTQCACCGEEVNPEALTRCPRCKRDVCDECFILTCEGGMCEDCAITWDEAREKKDDRREEDELDEDEDDDVGDGDRACGGDEE